jgi:4-hydroxyphenylpyruvate dioxygenase-like putative hemolysin
MPTPGTHHDALPGRLTCLGIGRSIYISVLRDLEILVTGMAGSNAADLPEGVSASTAGAGLLLEIIQRKGDEGFGRELRLQSRSSAPRHEPRAT